MKKVFYKALFSTYLFLGIFASSVLAVDPPELSGIFEVVFYALDFFFVLISVIAVAMIVYGAYMWMSSGGDPQKTKQAQGVLTWAVIGLIFFMTFIFFMDTILGILGVELPTPDQDIQEVFDY